MSVSVSVLQDHINYTTWASARLLEAAGRLSPEELTRDFLTADKTVLGTLMHVYSSERLWLARVKGDLSPGLPAETEYNLAFLQTAWPELYGKWREWASSLNPESPTREVAYRDLKQNSWKQPLWQIVLHVVNHSTHHRGQASGFLRSMGHTPPSLDLIAFYRGRN